MSGTYAGSVVCDPAPGVATPPGGTFALTIDGAEASYRRQAAAGPGDPVETGTGKIGLDGQITLNGGFSGPTFQVASEYGGRVSVAGFHLAGRTVVTTRNGARTTLSCSVAFESKTSPPGQPSRRPDEPPPAPAAPPPPGQATALDGEYNGTLVCVDATDAKRRYRAAFTLVIAGTVARYQRALITTDGQPNGQFERGAGTIDASGTLRLEGIVGGSDWRIVARYGGVVSHPRPRITGSQIVTRKDGTSDTRNCMVDLEFSRPDTVASAPTAAPAQPGGSATLDGEYTGTIVCVAATDGKRAFQAVFSLTIAGTTARYQRPAIGPDGQPGGQFERGAGMIDASGALRLHGVFVASDRKIAGQYGGVVSRPRSRITGTNVLTRSDGTSDTRNCTVDLEFFR